jgi:muconolactone delta-isomerase
MLYHVTFHMDRQSLAALGGVAAKVVAAEVERVASAQKDGRLIGLWHLADGNGVIFILDAASHAAIYEELTTLPMFPHVKSITLLPLLPYPGFSEFSEGKTRSA